MIDVLFLTYQDYANTGWKFYRAARDIGLKCLALKGVIHPFYYPDQTTVHPDIAKAKQHNVMPIYKVESPGIKGIADSCRVIHFTSSTLMDIDGVDLNDHPVVVQHSGREYRVLNKEINDIYNQVSDATIIQMPDLLGKGARNEHLIYFPVDTDYIQPDYTRYGAPGVVFGHLPSQPEWKGTKDILKLAREMSETHPNFIWGSPKTYDDLTGGRIWYQNLEDLKWLDVLIDTCSAEAYGHPYGEWGNTAFEAAAMGKIVITNSHNIEKYKENYGDCEFIIANTIQEVEVAVEEILLWSGEDIYQKRKRTRCWAKTNHSIQATGRRLWNHVYRTMF
jgi:hypothetical protein